MTRTYTSRATRLKGRLGAWRVHYTGAPLADVAKDLRLTPIELEQWLAKLQLTYRPRPRSRHAQRS